MYRSKRRRAIPVLTVSGTYYDVGYDVGSTFATMIHNVLDGHVPLNRIYIKYYETIVGKRAYESCLEAVYKSYPNFLQELQGMSDGAKVPFYKLFLLHMDDIFPNTVKRHVASRCTPGCTSILINNEEEQLLGHVVDANKIFLNNMFVVKGRVTEWSPYETFTAVCFAGLLPGCIMGFNSHGLIYSVTNVYVKHLNEIGVPRAFVTRALLEANSIQKVKTTLRCPHLGLADALAVTIAFLKKKSSDLIFNIEASPMFPFSHESEINTYQLLDKFFFHCNRFHRLTIPEVDILKLSSVTRENTICSFPTPVNKFDLINQLGDMSNKMFNIFTDFGEKVISVAVGIFDLNAKTLALYVDNPRTTEPCIVLSLNPQPFCL